MFNFHRYEFRIFFKGTENAGKDSLNDASVADWTNTVEKIKEEFPALLTVVPEYGKAGGVELLGFTIELFKTK